MKTRNAWLVVAGLIGAMQFSNPAFAGSKQYVVVVGYPNHYVVDTYHYRSHHKHHNSHFAWVKPRHVRHHHRRYCRH